MGHWQYSYDPLGNLIQQTDALGRQAHFEYDRLNRLVCRWDRLTSNERGGENNEVRYIYDQGPFALG